SWCGGPCARHHRLRRDGRAPPVVAALHQRSRGARRCQSLLALGVPPLRPFWPWTYTLLRLTRLRQAPLLGACGHDTIGDGRGRWPAVDAFGRPSLEPVCLGGGVDDRLRARGRSCRLPHVLGMGASVEEARDAFLARRAGYGFGQQWR